MTGTGKLNRVNPARQKVNAGSRIKVTVQDLLEGLIKDIFRDIVSCSWPKTFQILSVS